MSVAARPLAGRVRVERSALPVVVLGAGAFLVGLLAVLTALDVTVLASFDEAVYQASAVRYTQGLPGSLLDDPAARGTARLPSLLIAPLYVLFEGDTALRLARSLNGVFWAASAVPLYLLARTVMVSPWRAAAAALLAIAVPWATISTVLFSEALSYLLFACALLAMVHALREPSWRRDLLVLVLLLALITTRVQFVVLPVAWLVVVLLFERRDRRSLRASFARFPLLLGGAAFLLAAVFALMVVGGFRGEFSRFAGPYSELQNRTTLPGDAGLASLWEIGMLSLGVGLIPAALCMGWLREAVTGRAGPDARRLSVLAVVLIGVLFAATMFAQGGWLDTKSEERYYLYAVPLLWIGALAALEVRGFPARWIGWGGAVLAALLFLLPITVQLTSEQAFLGPVSGVAAKLLPQWSTDLAETFGKERVVTPRDLLGWIAVLVTVLAVVLWRRARWLALVPAVILQLAIGAYAYAALHGEVKDVGGITGTASFDDLSWVDHALPGGARAALLDNALSDVREGIQRTTAFWNADVDEVVRVRGAAFGPVFYPVDALGVAEVEVRDDLTVPGLERYVVTRTASPFFQPAGSGLRATPDNGMQLIDTGAPTPDQPSGELPRAVWVSRGLDPDGHVVRPVATRVAPGLRMRMALGAAGETRLRVTIGGRTQVARDGFLAFDTCGAPGVVRGTIAADRTAPVDGDRRSGGIVRSVEIAPC